MTKLISYIKKSLSLKIALIFAVGTIGFVALTLSMGKYIIKTKVWPRVQHNAVNYVNLLLEEMGDVPDTVRAGEVAEEFDVFIALQNDTLFWKSDVQHEIIYEDDLEILESDSNTWAGLHKGSHLIRNVDNTKYYFSLEERDEGFSYFEELLLFTNISFFLFIIYIIYRLLKTILKPISRLNEGVINLGSGNFNQEIKTTRIDELGEITNSFNSMSKQVSNMIKSKEQLLLNVSHEMRSPLTRVKVALEFIKDRAVANNIHDDIEEMENMITEILETERIKSEYGGLKKAEFDLVNLVNEMINQYDKREPGVELVGMTEKLIINADKERLRLLFKNLLENAFKYSEEFDSRPIDVIIIDNGSGVRVQIKDYGAGIPSDQVDFIFEPFYRVDKSRSKQSGGYGLGLHLCKNIVDAHGGIISVKSKLKEGTTFTILLPK